MQQPQKVFTWKPEIEITITGLELNAISQALNFAIAANEMLQDVFTRGVMQGKIEAKYIGENGEYLSEDQVNVLVEKLSQELEKEIPQLG